MIGRHSLAQLRAFTIAALLVALPIAAFLMLGKMQAFSRVEGRLEDIAEIAAGLAEEAIARAEGQISSFARVTDLEMTPAAQNYLNEIVYVEPFFREASVIAPNGKLVYSTARAFDEPFMAAEERRANPDIVGPHVVGRFRTRVMGEESIFIGMIVAGRGEVMLLVNPDMLTLALNQVDLGGDGRLLFVQADGTVLAASHGHLVPAAYDFAQGVPGRFGVVVPAVRGRLSIVVDVERSWVLREWRGDVALAIPIAAFGAVAAGFGALRLLGRPRGLHNDLREGLERDELVVDYQPIVSLETGACVGVEALVRWDHPYHGRLAPSVFIPMAVEDGLLGTLTRRVLARVAADYPSLSASVDDLRVNINCPAYLLLDGTVERLLDASAAPRLSDDFVAHLVFELTEDSFVGDRVVELVGIMDDLRARGIRFALDDFGTGYSGLAAVKDIKFEYLKIDRVFVHAIGGGEPGALLVDMLVELSKALGAKAVAEGVETTQQRDHVSHRGVALAQGWHYSRALPAQDIIRFIRACNRAA